MNLANNKQIDKLLMVASLIFVFGLVFILRLVPEQSKNTANLIFAKTTEWFGLPVIIFTAASLCILLYIAFSKYGNIRLGKEKPEYSTYSWIAMMLSAGLAAGTVYWGFVEWGYYFTSNPNFWGVEMSETMKYQYALSYNQFHWGPSAWGLYAICAIPVAYHFHVKKRDGLNIAAVIANVFDSENPDRITHSWVGKLVNFLYIFATIGAIGLTMGLTASMITGALGKVFGFEATFTTNLLLICTIAVVYSLSSYLGIEKGMRRISDWNSYLAICFVAFIVACGPSLTIFKSIFNGMGLTIANYIRMSTWTEPFASTGFVDGWTVFYWLYWIVFGPMMGIFVTKISKGRTLKEVVLNMLVSGVAGVWIFHGVLANYTMVQNIAGTVDAAGLIAGGDTYGAIYGVLGTLPLSGVTIFVFALMSTLFLATTLDSSSFTLAATVMPKLKENEEPSPILRLVWCFMLSAVPLTMIMIGADLNTFKTLAIATALPFTIIICIMIYGFMRDMFADYGEKTAKEIEEEWDIHNIAKLSEETVA